MFKKILIIILAIIILLAGVIAYFYFFSKKPTQQGEPTFSLSDIFPFTDDGINQNGDDTTPDPITDNPLPNEPGEPTKPPKLRMVNRGPISGAIAFDVTRELPLDPKDVDKKGNPLPAKTEPATKVRYVETSTGHINESYLDILEIKKITSTTIPKIAEAYFAGKGSSQALLRYAGDKNTIQTFTGAIPVIAQKDGTADTTLRGSYLPQDITTMAVSPDRDKIFTVVKNDSGSIGTISLPDGTKKNQIFSLAFSEWLTEWPSTKFVTITTRPSAKVPGYLYSIDATTKTMKKIIGAVNGLTTLTSPDMKNVVFSRSNNGSITTSIYNTTAKSVIPLPGATTLPEKCVWQSVTILYCAVPSYLPNGDYPDNWYQGSVSFVDQIYKIDAKNFTAEIIGKPSTVGAAIDAVNLSVDPANRFLIFINKKDGSLWSLDLRPDVE